MKQRTALRAGMLALLAGGAAARGGSISTTQPTAYMVGYAHLDTQWRWSYPQTIREFLHNTLHDNFKLLDKYPEYVFNFTGARRYALMKEYFPADYERMKRYVAEGRWIPAGSSVDECDVNVSSAESLIRQVLYGNEYFRREFGKVSAEFMLPDCFGFPASMPTVLAHCGLRGFSTQKLSWGSAVGIPFNFGVWMGLDGTTVLAALNGGDYTGKITEDLSISGKLRERLAGNGEKLGIPADYLYYGTGDVGGAPTEDSVKWLQTSLRGAGPVKVVAATAEQMFLDVSPAQEAKLPRYQGDLLLTEHSAGSITSQAYMKRCNRRNEVLADAAERAAVAAAWAGAADYPQGRLNDAWTLVLGSQMHDILPGTCLPKAYEFAWNDELLATNQFAGVVESSMAALASGLDTTGEGVPIIVFNPLSIEREDVVEARIRFTGPSPPLVQVFGPDGREMPGQVLGGDREAVDIAFVAKVPSIGVAVYRAVVQQRLGRQEGELSVTPRRLENARYRVTLGDQGDVASIFDKRAKREVLSAPMRLAFLHDNPEQWPAWNVDWADRQKPPRGFVSGPATIRVVESGPARVALQIERSAEGSRFVQQVRLCAGEAGNRVEFVDRIDWRSRECSLKATFPLAVSNPRATYNWEIGTIDRPNNHPKQYEVPTRQWMDLTDPKGEYGVTILTDCKYGADKPDDRTLRLTLLRTPGTRGGYQDQGTQDWGRHEIVYGLSSHEGDWRRGEAAWQALRLNQPLLAFRTVPHTGSLGRSFSLAGVSTRQVRVMALKKAERSDEVIVRLVELDGGPVSARVSFCGPVSAAQEVDGQERPIGEAAVEGGALVTTLGGYRVRSFAVRLAPSAQPLRRNRSLPLRLPLDRRVASRDGEKMKSGFDAKAGCLPREMLPSRLQWNGVTFALADSGGPNAMAAHAQDVALPQDEFSRLHLLAASAGGDKPAVFFVDGKLVERTIQAWDGYIGQWYNRTWKGAVKEMTYEWPNEIEALRPAYVKPGPVAWFCSHRHDAAGANEPYAYSYLFVTSFDLPAGAKSFMFPMDEKIVVLAATIEADPLPALTAAQTLLDRPDATADVALTLPDRVATGSSRQQMTPEGPQQLREIEIRYGIYLAGIEVYVTVTPSGHLRCVRTENKSYGPNDRVVERRQIREGQLADSQMASLAGLFAGWDALTDTPRVPDDEDLEIRYGDKTVTGGRTAPTRLWTIFETIQEMAGNLPVVPPSSQAASG